MHASSRSKHAGRSTQILPRSERTAAADVLQSDATRSTYNVPTKNDFRDTSTRPIWSAPRSDHHPVDWCSVGDADRGRPIRPVRLSDCGDYVSRLRLLLRSEHVEDW